MSKHFRTFISVNWLLLIKEMGKRDSQSFHLKTKKSIALYCGQDGFTTKHFDIS